MRCLAILAALALAGCGEPTGPRWEFTCTQTETAWGTGVGAGAGSNGSAGVVTGMVSYNVCIRYVARCIAPAAKSCEGPPSAGGGA